jgi:hypothetical protein
MIKMFSNIQLQKFIEPSNYKDTLSNKWKENCINIIEDYIIKNKCIIYGSKSIKLSLQMYNIKNNLFVNDIDIYSTKPKNDIINMYELIVQKEYCWSAKIIMARNVGTFTLFVNECKLVDCTYIDKIVYDNILTYKFNNFKFCNYYLSLSDYISILSDQESKYMLQKSIEKISLIQNYFPLSINDKICSNIQLNDDFINKLNNTLLSASSNDNKINYINILNNYPIIFLDNNGNCLNINNVEKKIQIIKLNINGIKNDLPYYNKYININNDYCFTGSIVCNIISTKFKRYIPQYNKIELYVTDINYYLPSICKLSTNNKIQVELGHSWSSLFKTFVKIKFDNIEIYLFELSKQRQYFIYNSIHCCSVLLLYSHLLVNATLLDTTNYDLYISILYSLIEIKNKYYLDDIFLNKLPYTIGLLESQKKVNENIIEVNKNDDYLIC